jgi:hypothetical protein
LPFVCCIAAGPPAAPLVDTRQLPPAVAVAGLTLLLAAAASRHAALSRPCARRGTAAAVVAHAPGEQTPVWKLLGMWWWHSQQSKHVIEWIGGVCRAATGEVASDLLALLSLHRAEEGTRAAMNQWECSQLTVCPHNTQQFPTVFFDFRR